jgi:hypothetical protein
LGAYLCPFGKSVGASIIVADAHRRHGVACAKRPLVNRLLGRFASMSAIDQAIAERPLFAHCGRLESTT